MDNSWDSIDKCFKERDKDDISYGSLDLIKDTYQSVKKFLLENKNIQDKVDSSIGIDVLILYSGFGYREAYLLSRLFSDKSGGELKFNRLVIVDRILDKSDSQRGLQCLQESGFVNEIYYFSNFKNLAKYFSSDPKHNPNLDMVLEIHGQIAVGSSVREDNFLDIMSVKLNMLKTINEIIEAFNYMIIIPKVNTIPVVKLYNSLIETKFTIFYQYYNEHLKMQWRDEEQYDHIYNQFIGK